MRTGTEKLYFTYNTKTKTSELSADKPSAMEDNEILFEVVVKWGEIDYTFRLKSIGKTGKIGKQMKLDIMKGLSSLLSIRSQYKHGIPFQTPHVYANPEYKRTFWQKLKAYIQRKKK